MSRIENRPIADLQVHPLNREARRLFGTADDAEKAELLESVKLNGIREPLHITDDGYVLRGADRLWAAGRCNVEIARCVVVPEKELDTPAKLRDYIFEGNTGKKWTQPEPVARLLYLFPPKDYPGLYQDSRGPNSANRDLLVEVRQVTGWGKASLSTYLSRARARLEAEKKSKGRAPSGGLPDLPKAELRTIRSKIHAYMAMDEKIERAKAQIEEIQAEKKSLNSEFITPYRKHFRGYKDPLTALLRDVEKRLD